MFFPIFVETCSLGLEKKRLRGIISMYSDIWLEEQRQIQTVFSEAQRQDEKHHAKIEILDIIFEWKKKLFFYCKSCSALEKVAQRGCWVSILGDIQNLTGHDPEQPELIDCALSKRNRCLPGSLLNSTVLCQYTYNEVITVNWLK